MKSEHATEKRKKMRYDNNDKNDDELQNSKVV